jgi:exo-beta-1,3-glucanase (GH17 family)
MVSEAEVNGDIALIASRKLTHIRTYSEGGPNDVNVWNVPAAAKHGLKVAVGVGVEPNNLDAPKARIDSAWKQAELHPDTVLLLVIGNEVDRTDNVTYTPDEIQAAMAYARSERSKHPSVPQTTSVTTCFSGTVLQNASSPWGSFVDECEEIVYLTVYPWYGGAAPDNIDPQMRWSWENGLSQVTNQGKTVVIAEIGWPSAGGRETTPENARTNYAATKRWVSGQNFLNKGFDTFWFEMFDEPWKSNEGPQGPHWGLCNSDGTLKFDF